MDLPRSSDAASRFSAYVDGLTSVIGHANRAKPLRDYCTGLMMPCERKSVEPMAAVTAPERTAAQHQSLLHFVGEGNPEGVAAPAARGRELFSATARRSRRAAFSFSALRGKKWVDGRARCRSGPSLSRTF
jgi:SRSO17 transposase